VFVLVFVLVVGESDDRCRGAAIEATQAGIGIASRLMYHCDPGETERASVASRTNSASE